jgi:hypothetical protein
MLEKLNIRGAGRGRRGHAVGPDECMIDGEFSLMKEGCGYFKQYGSPLPTVVVKTSHQ